MTAPISYNGPADNSRSAATSSSAKPSSAAHSGPADEASSAGRAGAAKAPSGAGARGSGSRGRRTSERPVRKRTPAPAAGGQIQGESASAPQGASSNSRYVVTVEPGADVEAVAAHLEEVTGRDVTVDPNLPGVVMVAADDGEDPDEAWPADARSWDEVATVERDELRWNM